MKLTTKITIFLLFLVVTFGVAFAQFAKPEEAVIYRKSVMILIVQHFKSMGAVVQGKADYNKDAFSVNADVVKMLATLPWDAMRVPGTDKGDTTQSSAVFDKPAQFQKAADSFIGRGAAVSLPRTPMRVCRNPKPPRVIHPLQFCAG